MQKQDRKLFILLPPLLAKQIFVIILFSKQSPIWFTFKCSSISKIWLENFCTDNILTIYILHTFLFLVEIFKMLTKATIESVQFIIYLCHKLAVVPIRFKNLTCVCNHTSWNFHTILNLMIWPVILLISLILTIFELSYFSLADIQIHLIILLYHGSILVMKIGASIAFLVYNTAPHNVCQLFNAVIVFFC